MKRQEDNIATPQNEIVSDNWSWEIGTKEKWFNYDLRELASYKELLFRLVRRDLLSTYQQTIIGRFWIFLQPLLTTLVYVIVFGTILNTSTLGIPKILFYLPGTIIWNFFADIFVGTMYTFLSNSHIFSKVYFPRILIPLSVCCTQFIRLGIQLALFAIIYTIYSFFTPGLYASTDFILIPLLLLQIAGFAFGAGLIASVVIAKYRDVENFIQFMLRLFMFATPVFYTTTIVPKEYIDIIWINPLTSVIETFRSVFLSHEVLPEQSFMSGTITVVAIMIAGLALFKKQELKVMDVI
ncbi:MAG: ABC transporter permease [Sphingobacteriales bacterium]|nr:MAG: ABC transporter permease [Sphingobacteriales bacterium]